MAARVLRGKHQIFDGTYTESREFLTSIQLYLFINGVRDQPQRVNITLNHIRGERVDSWVSSKRRWLDAVSNDSALLEDQEIWSVFEEDFLREFADPVERAKARKEIEELKMKGVELESYIQDFCQLARKALYDLNAPYSIHLFLQGLPTDLVRCCVDRDKLTTFEDWVDATRKYRKKYRYILRILNAPPLSNEEALVLRQARANAARDPSTTDVNTQQKVLTEEDVARYRREGRCFRCGRQGHFSKMCLQKGGTTSRPITNEKRETQSSLTKTEMLGLEIRAMSIEERKEFIEYIQDDPSEFGKCGPTSRPTSPLRTGVIRVELDDGDKA